MTDWSESFILINRHMQDMQHLLNDGKYAEAVELTFTIDAEVTKLRNAAWKEGKP